MKPWVLFEGISFQNDLPEVNDNSPYTYRTIAAKNSTFVTFSYMSTSTKVSNTHFKIYYRFKMDTRSIYGLIFFGT